MKAVSGKLLLAVSGAFLLTTSGLSAQQAAAVEDAPVHRFTYPLPADVTPPTAIQAHECRNSYPGIPVSRNVGATTLKLIIEADGTTKVSIIESSGNSTLDKVAMDCFASAKWNPALENGEPVEVERDTRVVWKFRRR